MSNESPQEDRFQSFVSILIATVTIIAATTAFLQAFAGNQAAEANRQAQELSLQATTKRVTGAVQFSYDWQGAFQTWREIDLQIIHAEQEGDTLAIERYTELRDRVASLSPLLGPPYYETSVNWPDSARYEADLYIVDSTRLTEQFTAQAELGNAWDDIANAFVIQLTLLAVTLSLYGLSNSLKSWVRWLFVFVGLSMVVFNLGWMAYLLIAPLPELPQAAIEAYAQGVGMAYQARDQEAIQYFDQALSIQPEYANALYERANSYFYLGDYTNAAQGYEAALDAGRDDTSLGWNLGWTYYLLGQFDDAVSINQQALTRDPTLIGLRMNQGLVLLAAGRFGNAEVEYTRALEEAARQVSASRAAGQEPPSSLWFYLDAGAADLESLLDTLNGTPKAWTQSPPASVISTDLSNLQNDALGYIRGIKEASASLEYTGQLPGLSSNAMVPSMQAGEKIDDDAGNFLRYDITESFPNGTNDVVILFDYSGMQTGQSEIWKVYVNGFEDPSLRVVSDWKLEDTGSAVKQITFAYSNVFVFTPGEYVVELYVDYHLMQSVKFFVEE
ncbi:MAG TPA: tetratricopeptide repeat protein [Anaerolineales bacterium]|nr:tetratricopeptide repeat protein [Anaerolineales bacterium]